MKRNIIAEIRASKARKALEMKELAQYFNAVKQRTRDTVQKRSELWLLIVDDAVEGEANCKRNKGHQHGPHSCAESLYDVDVYANAINRLDTVKNEHNVTVGETRSFARYNIS